MLAPGDLVRAEGILTLLDIIPTDVLVVAGQTYLDIATPIAANDFDDGADDTATAVNIALAVNKSGPGSVTTFHTDTVKNVGASATSSGAVVTLIALLPGTTGNGVILNSVDSTITADGATLGTSVAGAGVLEDHLQSLLDEVQLNSEAISMIAHLTSRSSD